MLQFVSLGYFKGVVCLCWDRISRNKGDDTVVRKLMRRGVDFHLFMQFMTIQVQGLCIWILTECFSAPFKGHERKSKVSYKE